MRDKSEMIAPESGHEFLELMKRKNNRDHQAFSDFERFLDFKARENGIPIVGQFELTPLCNFDCKMCYAHLTPEQLQSDVMTVPQWKALIDQAYEAGMYRATLTGGECLAYPGFKDIYLYLHSLGCEVSILTNGSLLDADWVKFFVDHRPVRIQITLYGDSEDSYEKVTGRRDFRRVIDNIDRIREAELPLSITTTPNRYLGDAIIDTVRVSKAHCPFLNVNPSISDPREETGRAGQNDDVDWDLYVEIYRTVMELDGEKVREIPEDQLPPIGGPCSDHRKYGIECAAGMSAFSIDWKGIMHPCNRLYQCSAYPMRDGFQKAWEEIHQIALQWPRVPECEGCAYKAVCTTCVAEMSECAEPGQRPERLCERTRYFVKHGVWPMPEC